MNEHKHTAQHTHRDLVKQVVVEECKCGAKRTRGFEQLWWRGNWEMPDV